MYFWNHPANQIPFPLAVWHQPRMSSFGFATTTVVQISFSSADCSFRCKFVCYKKNKAKFLISWNFDCISAFQTYPNKLDDGLMLMLLLLLFYFRPKWRWSLVLRYHFRQTFQFAPDLTACSRDVFRRWEGGSVASFSCFICLTQYIKRCNGSKLERTLFRWLSNCNGKFLLQISFPNKQLAAVYPQGTFRSFWSRLPRKAATARRANSGELRKVCLNYIIRSADRSEAKRNTAGGGRKLLTTAAQLRGSEKLGNFAAVFPPARERPG